MNIKNLIKNKKEAIKLKKAELKKADIIESGNYSLKIEAFKDVEDTDTELYRTIVGNTYGFMDSHDDVHMKGIFTKTIKENGENVLHLHDHVHQLSAKVGTPLKVYEQEVEWAEVGLNKAGKATALLMDSRIEKSRNENIFTDYKTNSINQHSVGMQYMKLELAVNNPEEKEEYMVWERYKDEVINLEKAIEKGFFWAVTEAKLIEISCVIKGSNELTPTLEAKNNVDEVDTFVKLMSENPTKENILHLCNQFKALSKGEPLDLTLPKAEPQKKNYFEILAKA
jgi:DUF971 family protein